MISGTSPRFLRHLVGSPKIVAPPNVNVRQKQGYSSSCASSTGQNKIPHECFHSFPRPGTCRSWVPRPIVKLVVPDWFLGLPEPSEALDLEVNKKHRFLMCFCCFSQFTVQDILCLKKAPKKKTPLQPGRLAALNRQLEGH